MNVLVTGASRGLGLGMVKYFLANTTETVVATCRNPSSTSDLTSLEAKYNQNGKKRLFILALDTTSKTDYLTVLNALANVGIKSLDILILNAGIASSTHPHNSFMDCSVEDMSNLYNTNVIGTMLSLQSFYHLVSNSLSKVVIVISSRLGSITHNNGDMTSYRASKCALNMLAMTYSQDEIHLMSDSEGRVKVVCLHPGWVQTDMGSAGGRQADISVEESVSGMMRIIYWTVLSNSSSSKDNLMINYGSLMNAHQNTVKMASSRYQDLVIESNCSFVNYDGHQIEW